MSGARIDTGCERWLPTMANRRGDPPNISGHTFLQLCLGLYSFGFGLACISNGLYMAFWIGLNLDWFLLFIWKETNTTYH